MEIDSHSHFRRWGAAYLLAVLFFASWTGQFVATLIEVGASTAEDLRAVKSGRED